MSDRQNRKFKIRKSIADRVRITKTGKVLHRSTFNRHLKSAKSKSQKRRLNRTHRFKGRLARNVKKIMGV